MTKGLISKLKFFLFETRGQTR